MSTTNRDESNLKSGHLNGANIIQSLIAKSKYCTLTQLYTAQDYLRREKEHINSNINHMQSNIGRFKLKNGDTNVSLSKNQGANDSNISRKRKRKRQADYDEDFDVEDFDFFPTRDTTGDEPVSALNEPDSAILNTMDTSSLDAGGAGGLANGTVGRGSKKNSRKKKATTSKNSKKKRKKGKYSKLDDDKDLDSNSLMKEDYDDEVGYGLQGKDVSQIHIQFWRMVDEHFQPVHNDPEKMKLLEPVDIENDEDIHEIPELGTHYLQRWMEEKNESDVRSQPKSGSASSDMGKSVDLDIACEFFDSNSITVRLLQSMVEEQDVINIKKKSKKGRPKVGRNSKLASDQQAGGAQSTPSATPSVSKDLLPSDIQNGVTACTDDYRSAIMSQVDDRVTQELRLLGLFEDPESQGSDSLSDEGDEVLNEIKRLQKELRGLIETSNHYREKIKKAVQEREAEEEMLVQRRIEDKKIIKDFERRVFNPKVR